MSVIVQQPDSLSFAGNLKKFVVTSAVAVALQLNKGAEQILNEIYQPSAGNIVEIDLRTVIDKVLSVTLPGTNLITEQSSGFADFTATIDGTAVAFRVIKGGVLELGELASTFADDHFLTWQIQNKTILQHQPEWLTIYANAGRNLKAKAYYQDNTNASMLLTALAAGKLLAVDVSWASINALFVKKNPIAWDVWFEDLAGTRLSYVQRYCLRNSIEEEKIFIWANTMGGIDSISLTGSAEDDKKLEHLIAEMGDESLQEYQTDKKREIKQSTGFLTVEESRWIEDFFYSGRRYLVGEDGAVRSIVLASSKIVGSTADDLFDYEFNYRLASESQLLNLERSFESLPALEVPVDFFLTELLSGLPVAQYADSLLMAVQSPFAQAWQKLSMAQLWGSALPGLVDGTTISVVNGKLQVNGVSGGVGVSKWGDLTEKPFSTLSNLFSVSPEGILTLSNNYAAANHTHPYLSDSDARIGNWTTAYNWGDHAGKYRPVAWVPAWAYISNKPEWLNRMGWNGTATVVSSDLHVTGKLVVDGTIQFFGAGAGGGTGGGGASALWELTDVADDMINSLYGDLPMYNGTHFARYNISNFALAGHTHAYLSDADARIVNWNNAFNWGNHAGLYRGASWLPTWAEVSEKPTWTEKMGWDGTSVTVSTDLHITGKLVVDGTIQFFGSGTTGGGGGGASALWQLSDVADEMEFSINGDIPLYNGTHFARYNISNLALSGHNHTIAQVTGLQGSLDGKQASLGYIPYYSANFVAGVNYSAPHSHPYLSDSDARIANWSTAFGWGSHAGLYRPIGYVPNWGEITSKPTWTEKFGWDGSAVTVSTDVHITGKLVVDGTIQFFGSGTGGTGGGGSTTLWGLSDVADDVSNAVYGDLIMYNGTHFARINQSVLAPAVHSHTIGQVTGLQGSLDGKQVTGSYITEGDSRLTNARVASDVYAWAKASVKPSYVYNEIGDAAIQGVAANTSSRISLIGNVINAAGYITRFTVGLNRGASGWGEGIIGIGTNDAGTTFTDFRLNVNGRMYSPAGTFALTSELPTRTSLSINLVDNTADATKSVNYAENANGANWAALSANSERLNGRSDYRLDLPPASGNWWRGTPLVLSDGTMGIGKYIDFHASDAATTDYDLRLTASTGLLNCSGAFNAAAATFSGSVTAATFIGSLTGNAATATNASQLLGRTDYWHSGNLNLSTVPFVASKLSLGTTYAGFTANIGGTMYMMGANTIYDIGHGIQSSDGTAYVRMYSSQVNVTAPSFILTNPATTGDGSHSVNIGAYKSGVAYNSLLFDANNYSFKIKAIEKFAIASEGNATFSCSVTASTLTASGVSNVAAGIASSSLSFCGSGIAHSNICWKPNERTIEFHTSITGQGTDDYWGAVNLKTNGSIVAGGNIIGLGTMQFYTASDRRLKTDFETILNPIEKIKSLTGYFFNYNDEGMRLGGYANRRDIGLIAQDVHSVLPEATGKLWNTDFMGYKAEKLIPLLVEAIKQQQNEIDQLKKQIAA